MWRMKGSVSFDSYSAVTSSVGHSASCVQALDVRPLPDVECSLDQVTALFLKTLFQKRHPVVCRAEAAIAVIKLFGGQVCRWPEFQFGRDEGFNRFGTADQLIDPLPLDV